MSKIYNNTKMTKTRQALRKGMPKAEIIFWSYLKGRQVLDLKFRRQYSVDTHVVDFYCAEKRLAIELDGESHLSEKQQKKDQEKQNRLEENGIKLIRYWNTDIYENIDGVIEDLIHQINNT
ncbi:MAG: DUF559 domain-containing protein [Candidatus Marinimicrobia bacterium]|nr:DUF559 domain-containing protein [Candidatus Neomarinimicrobiota bacterium]MBT3675588.1 DUF559 domain-containing protein [Candidatus Neomarinimicrobiota bacterium]MBT3762886.1 DUF559 domain-containing protein [Candidatus Neomarinimicrobiota bacterium]MBT4067700.1 DUF559 domain-containing protein [Candidatus Neomarinimicrobiota bacterium]MBT4271255.1 DUF559 domain-containing protein [Candidatus Neomarinimicrobiota bacterium]